jgi:hypothetical protein
MLGGSVGIALGCLVGMIPLAFISFKSDREESPRDIFNALATHSHEILRANRYCGSPLLDAQLFHAAPSQSVCTISGDRQYV